MDFEESVPRIDRLPCRRPKAAAIFAGEGSESQVTIRVGQEHKYGSGPLWTTDSSVGVCMSSASIQLPVIGRKHFQIVPNSEFPSTPPVQTRILRYVEPMLAPLLLSRQQQRRRCPTHERHEILKISKGRKQQEDKYERGQLVWGLNRKIGVMEPAKTNTREQQKFAATHDGLVGIKQRDSWR